MQRLAKNPLDQPEPVEATTIRIPSTQYLVIDSADRQQNATFTPAGDIDIQPWNNFRIQKRQSVLNAFARRIQPVEIRFPWFIPNITRLNNTIVLGGNGGDFVLTLPLAANGANIGFYTPTQIVTALNAAIVVVVPPPAVPPVFSYDSATMQYTFDNPIATADTFTLNTAVSVAPGKSAKDFFDSASLMRTLGFTPLQQAEAILPGSSMTGLPCLSSYTDYVDICSDKLMYYTDVKDGSSADRASSSSVMIRLYANDEVSIPTVSAGVPITCAPFMIHRQFKNAKSIKWDSQAVIDWLDIQVYDMFGNLIPLPTNFITETVASSQPGYYPDFQITMLASEN
jgi:hypothetical protein